MALQGIHKLIDTAESGRVNFPLTLLYNEGWLLRLVLDWYSRHQFTDQPLLFQPGAGWFSEALLPTHFKTRYRGDTQGETRTHADGIIGHFSIGKNGKADVSLLVGATQFIVTEAKINSPLSGGVRYAPGFDQAARNVACIAELLSQVKPKRSPSQMTSLAFFVMTPEAYKKVLAEKLDKSAIRCAVEVRVKEYSSEPDGWLEECFFPTLDTICIKALSWESLINFTASKDPQAFQSLQGFYEHCLEYNGSGTRHVANHR